MTTQTRYRLGGRFVLRMTGFPVELLQRLRAPELVAACDAALAADAELTSASEALLELLRERGQSARGARKRVEKRRPLELEVEAQLVAPVARYHAAIEEAARASAAWELAYTAGLEQTRGALYRTVFADERLRQVLLLSSPGLEAITKPLDAVPTRNTDWRQREHTWMSYVQRVSAKNETVSFFGPAVWGQVDPQGPTVDIELRTPDVDRRVVYFERWVCESIAAQIAADDEARPLLPVTVTDDVIFTEDGRVTSGAGEEHVLSPDERALVVRCAHEALRGVSETQPLVDRGVLARKLVVPLTSDPISYVRAEVEAWPEGAARARWSERLRELERCRARLEAEVELDGRRAVMRELDELLSAWSVASSKRSVALYTSRLPFNEDCRRRAERVRIGGVLVEQLEQDLAPWYEYWRDLAGLYATRVHEAVRGVWEALGARPVPLSRWFAACDEAGLPMRKTGGQGVVATLDQAVQQAWQAQLGARASEREVRLDADDLAFLRKRFTFRRMKAGDLPAPDVQIASPSPEAIAAGQFVTILGEIHPDFVHWQNCFSMWCPDLDAFAEEYRRRHGPSLLFGQQVGDTSAHTTLPRGRMGGWTAIGPYAEAGVRSVRIGDALVSCTDDDVLVTTRDGEVLGSMLHTWSVALNTHQLELLGENKHAPRLWVGRVVVQRESWIVEPDEEAQRAAEKGGVVAAQAMRGLRRRYGLPEEVFIKPLLPYRMSLHKDGKPIFVDFRNPLSLEMLAVLVKNFRTLRATEMLPLADDCWLRDEHGRYSCELRLAAYPDAS